MIKPITLSANAHIENLKQQLEQSKTDQLDYLILAHPDSRMLSKLQIAFENKSIAIIALPQNCWSMDDESVGELVDWTLNETSAKVIMLVGHSQGGTPEESIQVCPSGSVDGSSQASVNRIRSLMDRVNEAQACIKSNESHFANELMSLRNQVTLKNDRVANPEIIQGIFYRAESGVFCAFDAQGKTFHALLGNSLVG